MISLEDRLREQSPTFWSNERALPLFTPLNQNLNVDVCIIGGGITGITTAYLLSHEKKNVVVIEDGLIAEGETSRTTAHLSNVLDDHFQELERLFGQEGAKLAAESHKAAIDFIEKTVAKEKIQCSFERVEAYLFNPPEKQEIDLKEEFDASLRAGLRGEIIERAPFQNFDTGMCLKFYDQAQFEPIEYIQALCSAIVREQGKIFTETHVQKIEKINQGWTLTTNKGFSIHAKQVVIATNSSIANRVFPHLKLAAYRTYVITGKIPKGTLPKGLYYDTLDPYHYLRIFEGDDADEIIVGGEDHRVGEMKEVEEIYDKLEKWTKHHFPTFTPSLMRWSGQILEPVDSLAYIGKSQEHPDLYIATGDSGNGLTHGTLGAILIKDLILNKENPWEKLYDPHRKKIGACTEFCKENLDTFWQYSDWLTPGEVKSESDIPKGSGAILREGMQKIAVYRDAEGKVHRFSAICPHLAAILRWNPIEKTWDCPAHGSRFTCLGKVINSPSIASLKAID